MPTKASTKDGDEPTRVLDSLESGDVVLFECGYQDDALVEVRSTSARLGGDGKPKQDALHFEAVRDGTEYAIYLDDFGDLVTKRITGSDGEVAEALDRDVSDLRKRPTELVIRWLERQDREDLFLREYDATRCPPLWMWDPERAEHYSDHDVTDILAWEDAESCPNVEQAEV